MDVIDDGTLVARLARDLDANFEAVVVGHADRLYSIALRMTGDARDAEEIAQDALVRAHRALASYDAHRIRALRLRPWLAAIAVNLARNRRRRVADRQPAVSLALVVGEADSGVVPSSLVQPADHVDAMLDRDRWATLLAGLPERYRAPLVLRYVDDLTYAEMTEALGRPEGTLKAQVHRGLALLRAAWEAAEREEAIA
jgi:RNA polymerase sigma-70 factor (ECF subfamily)